MKKLLLSLLCLAGLSATAQTYELVTSADDIKAGQQCILVANAGGTDGYWAMGASSNNTVTTAAYRNAVEVTVNSNNTCDITNVSGVVTFTLVSGTEAGTLALKLADGNYLTFTGTSTNNLNENAELTKAGSFNISLNTGTWAGTVMIQNADKTARALKFNYNNGTKPRYANYATGANAGQPYPYLYKLSTTVKKEVETPQFSVAQGEVEAGTQVEIDCATPSAEIYYTLDGKTPDKTSTLYTGAITITETTTVKAIAYVGGKDSNVATATYTVVALDSFEDVLGLANKATFKMGTDLTVALVPEGDPRYKYVYADGKYGLIYDAQKVQNLSEGDVIAKGWSGSMTFYAGLPELTTTATLTTTGATGTIPAPAVVAAADVTNALVNNIVKINNVAFADATPSANNTNFTGTAGTTELTFRNTFKVASVEAGTYNVTCVVSVFTNKATTLSDQVQILPVKFEDATTGIDDIEAEGNVAPVYYNLQGVRVANPENGLFIEVRGNKAVKVIK